jgi:hypothetical protein
MEIGIGDRVISVDGVEVGRVAGIERSDDGAMTGLLVTLDIRRGRESRLPAAWIAGLSESAVHLVIPASDLREPEVDASDQPVGNIFGRWDR